MSTTRSVAPFAALLALSLVACACSSEPPPPPIEPILKEVPSPLFTVDRPYRSELGPEANASGTFFPEEDEGLIWITGFRSMVVDGTGEPLSQDYLCHANLRYGDEHEPLRKTTHGHNRIFTVSQGQPEVKFDDGFGIPSRANRVFTIDNQLLNLGSEPADPVQVRFRNIVSVVRDEAIERDMVPLYQAEAAVLVSLGEGDACFDVAQPTALQRGAASAVGVAAGAVETIRTDEAGQDFTYHWLVEPGREVRRTLITRMLRLEYDTRIHAIALHLHPYAESIELRDLTDDRSLFTSDIRLSSGGERVESVARFWSEKGIPLYKDHDYELVSTYDNRSGEPRGAIALVYFYLQDKRFVRPPRG